MKKLLILAALFPALAAAVPTWSTIEQDNFTWPSNTSTGSAGSTTGVPVTGGTNFTTGTSSAWTDVAGGIYSINSNQLKAATSNGTGYLTQFLLRPSSENHTNQRIVLTYAASAVNHSALGVVLRYQSSTSNCYLAEVDTFNGLFYLYKIIGGSVTALVNGASLTGFNAAHVTSLDFQAYGTSSTTLAYVIKDVTSSTTLLSSSTTDSAASLQTSGGYGLDAWSSSGSITILATACQTYSGDFTVLAPTISASDGTGVTFSVAGQNGSTPYTLQLQRSTTIDGTFANVSGATGTSPKDTTGTQDVVYYYRVSGTDNASAASISPIVPGSAMQGTLNIGVIGDSWSVGGNYAGALQYYTDTAIQARLRELKGVRLVNDTNEAISGTDSGDWVPGGTDFTNAVSAFSAAGVQYVVVNLGINDARVPADSLVAGHRALGSATDGTTAGANGSYMKNMATIVNQLVADGYKVIVTDPGFVLNTSQYNNVVWDSPAIDLIQSYGGASGTQSLVNNSTVFGFLTSNYEYFADAWGRGVNEYYPKNGVSWNGVDPNQGFSVGVDTFADMTAMAIAKAAGLLGGAPHVIGG